MIKIFKMKDVRFLIEKVYIIKGIYFNERKKIRIEVYYREVQDLGLGDFVKVFKN